MQLIKLYQPFFDANNWAHVLTSGQDWMMILTLILMECLLSVDNAVVLAAQTQVLPTKDEQRKTLGCGLWEDCIFRFIVISIESMDIVFSIDSVLAALAMSNNPVVVLVGGMIGILCMRGVAEIIIKLMEIIPELQTMAYVLISIIAIKLLISLPPLNFKL